jgi:hypothetical protein
MILSVKLTIGDKTHLQARNDRILFLLVNVTYVTVFSIDQKACVSSDLGRDPRFHKKLTSFSSRLSNSV